MIVISDLLQNNSLVGNYFAPDAYVQGDFEAGLIENRSGARLIALPETLMQAIYASLSSEVGSSISIVLHKCGHWWGKNFYRRFNQEVSEYYGKSLAQMEMVEFLQCLKQCWKTHGWGLIDLETDYSKHGFMVVKVKNSAFAKAAIESGKPMCFVETGILSAFFSQLTGRDLHCVQASCESMGADSNHFILGLADRLKSVEAWVATEKLDPTAIMERLCGDS
jgi:uncharacterized protein